MIYINEYSNNWSLTVDTEKVQKLLAERHIMYVHPTSKEERVNIIALLEKDGFCVKTHPAYSKENAIDSRFPLIVDFSEKTYCHITNIHQAICGSKGNVIVSEKEFYDYLEKYGSNSSH